MIEGQITKIMIYFSLVCLLSLLNPSILRADIYYYVDQNGVWHFTNIKNDTHYRLYLKSMNKRADQYIRDYEDIITAAAQRFGIEPALIKAIIKSESDFDHQAISTDGAQGLMQLMPSTAVEMDVSNPMDPEENIFGGARYLSILIRHFRDVSLAVAAYNAGPRNVEHFKGIPPFPETLRFVRRVLKCYQMYRNQK